MSEQMFDFVKRCWIQAEELVGQTASVDEVNILDGVTATAAELNLVDGSVAGTAVASKAAVLGASKNLDILGLPVGGLKIGAAGAEVVVTPTAAEINVLAGVTAGTSAASKAAVLSASSSLTVLGLPVGGLKIGAAGAEVVVTPTAAEINVLAGVTAGTSAASKAAVLSASSSLTVLGLPVGGLKIGAAGAEVVVTPTAAEINVLAGVTAGTSAASKAAVLSASSSLTVLGLPVGGLKIGAAGAEVVVTASAAELNVLTGVTAGTITASKAVVVGSSKEVNEWHVLTAPVDYTHSSLGVGQYGTPVVDVALVDNIAFAVNMSTATNKTAADSSCMAAFIGVSNTAATTNNKMQGLLVSNMLGFNCYDAYAIQGHVTVGAGGVSTQNANAHITGLSGKALLTGAVGQGWVTGVLGIIDGTGAVTGLCHAIAGVVEATTTANACDAVCYLNADQTVPTAIEFAGTANMTNIFKFNAVAGGVVANALVPAAAPDGATMGADAALVCDVGGTPYYIPMYNTLHA